MPTYMICNTGVHSTRYYKCHMATAQRSLMRAMDKTCYRCTSVPPADERHALSTLVGAPNGRHAAVC